MAYESVVDLSGYFGAALSVIAYLPYMRDTIRHRILPDRASWLIWSVLSAISFFSQIYEGAGPSLGFSGAQMLATFVVFLLALTQGQGRFFTTSNVHILSLAGVGLVIWYLTSDAAYALAMSIGISVLGGSVTVRKAFHAPASESLVTWLLSFLAAGFAVASVGGLDWVLLAYPLYIAALSGSIVVAVLAGRARVLRADLGINPAAPPSAF